MHVIFWQRLALLVVLLFTAATVRAQEQEGRTGFGVSLQAQTLLAASNDLAAAVDIFAPTILVSSVTETNRFEPEIGFYRVAIGDEDDSSSSMLVQFGLGGFRDWKRPDGSLYVGGRIGAAFSTSGGTPIGSVGPVVGGTHLFGEHFSLGVEVELRYARPIEGGTSTLRTVPGLVGRYYL